MFKRFTALIVCLAAVAGLAACSDQQPEAADTDKVRVTVSFNAVKEFAAAVGGDKVELSTIIPDGTEPHDFEPKARDLVNLSAAQVFIYNGLGMEPWADDAASAAGNANLITVEASDGASLISNAGATEAEGQYDPHVWLSLKGAETEARNIKAALIKADPSNRDYYETNCTTFIAQLDRLYTEYSAKFAALKNKSFVTGHAAFAYLCRDFGLTQKSVEDVFAEGEPSARKLTDLVEYCKTNHVKTIFVEEMVSPDVSKTLAKEVGATVRTIDTMESGRDSLPYLDRMRDNLAAIYESLK